MYDNNFSVLDKLIKDFYNNFYTGYQTTEQRAAALKKINDMIAMYETCELTPCIDNGFNTGAEFSLNVPSCNCQVKDVSGNCSC